MIVFAGLDWDSKQCVAHVEVGERTLRANVLRDPGSVRAFVDGLGDAECVACMETGDAAQLSLWRQAGVTVYEVDAKKAAHFARSLKSSGASSDKRSAEVLCRMAASSAHRDDAIAAASAAEASLMRLLKAADLAGRDVVRHGNQLRDHLRQVHPALALQIGNIKAGWVIRLVEAAPTAAAWNALACSEQEGLLRGSRLARRSELVAACGTDWNIVPPELEPAVRLQAELMVAALGAAVERQRTARKALDAQVAEHEFAATLGETRGLGPVLVAGSICALEATGDASNRDRYAVATGCAPVTVASGEQGRRKPLVKMRRSASRILRKTAHLTGVQLVSRYRFARAQFSWYRGRGKPAAHAFRCISRSWGRILHAMKRDGTPFDEERYIAAVKQQKVTWAEAL
ncbi:MAG: hypothetical protein ACI9OJ_002125 [Myxococcota bacterium]|jgi:hypothetical protein